MNTKALIATLAAAASVAASASPASAAAPPATPLQKVSSEVQPGVVYLQSTYEAVVRDPAMKDLVGDRTFSVSYSCSGFFVTPEGHIGTAGHCVGYDTSVKEALLEEAARWSYANENWTEGTTLGEAIAHARSAWRVRSPEDPDFSRPELRVGAAYGVEVGGTPTGKSLPARVLGLRKFDGGDVALLKVEVDDVPALELASDDAVDVGTPIVSVGYPGHVDLITDQTFDPSFKDGTVSSVKTIDDGLRSVLEISGAMASGMSGGPTVDLEGRVIGVNSFGYGDSEQFNFVSPVEELTALMQDKGVENVLGDTNELYRDGLAAYWAGDRETALAKFDALLGRVTEHEFAQEFRNRALELPEAPEPVEAGGIPVAPIGIVLVVLAALGGTALVLARRRSQAGEIPVPKLRPRTRPTAETPVPSPAGGPALVLRSGPDAGTRIPLRGGLVLGRGGDADVRLDDAQVSRRHAAVRSGADGPQLEDLGSANGTRVNGARVNGTARLSHGDVIALGDSAVEVDLGPAARREQATLVTAVPA